MQELPNPSVSVQSEQNATSVREIACPPPPFFGFVGRDSVLLQLERTFQQETIVLLEGLAGVGKTETALAFARQCAETGVLNGPIFWFRFGHYMPLPRIIHEIGRVFNAGIKQEFGQDWDSIHDDAKRRGIVLHILRQLRCFIVWDNFEPVHGFPSGSESNWTAEEQGEFRQFLADLRGGATKLILTSRRDEFWLGPIYRRLPLTGLPLSEAQEFASRVLPYLGLDSRQLPHYNGLLTYLRGNPLAIQNMLPELASRQPEELVADLRLGELKMPAHEIQRLEEPLWAALNYRFEAVDPVVRRRLAPLGLFQGLVRVPMLQLISRAENVPEPIRSLDMDQWHNTLRTAATLALLHEENGLAFTLHPSLPWFFQDVLSDVNQDQRRHLERAFCAAYGNLGYESVEQFEKTAGPVLNLLQVEEANLLNALHLAQRHRLWKETARILYGLGILYKNHSRRAEWERLVAHCQTVLTPDGEAAPPEGEYLQHALWGHQREIAHHRRDFAAELQLLPKLRTYYLSIGDERSLAVNYQQWSTVCSELGLWDKAEQWCHWSLEISQRIGNEYGQAVCLHKLGIIAQEQQQLDKAEQYYQQSLEVKQRISDEYAQASTFHQLGRIAGERQHWDEAEQWYRKSLDISERFGDENAQAITLHQLGLIAHQCQQWDEAKQRYQNSLATSQRIGNLYEQANTLRQLGRVAQQRRHWAEAEQWYRQGLEVEQRLHNDSAQAHILYQLGRVAEERGTLTEAADYFQQSLALFKKLGEAQNVGIVDETLAHLQQKWNANLVPEAL